MRLFTGCVTDRLLALPTPRRTPLRAAAELMEAGADSARIADDLFETVSRKQMELENRIMDTLECALRTAVPPW